MNEVFSILLVWLEKGNHPRYFVFPKSLLKEREYTVLRSVANKHFDYDQDETDHNNLWCVKAAVSHKDVWVPESVGVSWYGKFVDYEINELPYISSTPIEFIQVG